MLLAWAFLTLAPLAPSQAEPGIPRLDPEAAPSSSPGPTSASSMLEEARALNALDSSGGLLTGGLGIERLGEDWFARLNLALGFDFENFGFGLQLPVRIRVIDEDPKNDGDLFGFVREEDWDSVADVLKVIRYVYVGQQDRKGPYYFRLGALTDVSLGHGTIIHRYRNDVDVNRWRVGAEAVGRIDAFGVHAFVGDITEPYLAGLRGTVRPLEMAFARSLSSGWRSGRASSSTRVHRLQPV